MVKHNNVIPNQHFKKKWQFYVRTWFNQPARKKRRHDGERRSFGTRVLGRQSSNGSSIAAKRSTVSQAAEAADR